MNIVAPSLRVFVRSRVTAGALMACAALSWGTLAAGPVTTPGDKNPPAAVIQDRWSLPGILGGGVKTTDEYTEGNIFLVLPVISTVGQDGLLSGDVLLIEPYSSWGEQGEVAASLGLGWRHYFTTQGVSAVTNHDGHQAGFFEEGVYVGANVFVDMLNTQFDNQFWQLGVGAEVGTRYLEIRGNYYIPLSDRQLALERRSRQTFQSSTVSTSQQVTGGDPFATGNTIQQDVTSSTLATTTTTTTTIEQLFRLYEEGMEGWDVQASVLVPGLDRWMDVFLIGGYYSFDNQPFGPQTGGTGNVEGWKAGVEVRPVPAVVLNATWYEDERFVGSDWLYGLRLEIPFEMGDLGDGKGFWDRVGDAFTPRRRHLAERLVEPVRRQNQAIQVGNDVQEEREVSTSVKRVTKVVSQSAQRIVLLDDVVFVNNGGPTGNGIQQGTAVGTGTAEQPVDTVQAGTNIAVANFGSTNRIWNVYTQGGTPYAVGADVSPGGSLKFIGSGIPIVGRNGRSFGTGHSPTINSGGINGIVAGNGGQYLGVFGYTLAGSMLHAHDYERVEFVGNLVQGNTIWVTAGGFNVTSQVLIENNTIAGSTSYGVRLIAGGNATLNADILNNTIERSTLHGITVFTHTQANSKVLVQGNSLINDQMGAIQASSANTIMGTGVDITIASNQISNLASTSIQFDTVNSARFTAGVFNNVITQSGGSPGILGQFRSTSTANIQVGSNTISNAFWGITLGSSDSANVIARVNQNTVLNSTNTGVLLGASGTSILDVVEFNGNTITGAGTLRHLAFDQVGTAVLHVVGTENNVAQPSPNPNPGGSTLDVTGIPSMFFFLNGAPVFLPVDLP